MTNGNDLSYPYTFADMGNPGLTKREYFAAMAMQGILAAPNSLDTHTNDIANSAVILADSLITALNTKTETHGK